MLRHTTPTVDRPPASCRRHLLRPSAVVGVCLALLLVTAAPPDRADAHGGQGRWVTVESESASYTDRIVPTTHHFYDFLQRPKPGWGRSRIGFVVNCQPVKVAAIDPIVSPGQAKSGHLHQFFGNPNVTPHTTTQSLIDTPSRQIRCTDRNDKSGYWTPVVRQNGQVVQPLQFRAYYKGQTPDTVAMPLGLRMIAGDATARSNQPRHVGFWQRGAQHTTAGRSTMISTGANGKLTLRMNFPNCWDGRHLDSPDHQAHMAYAKADNCPRSHPVKIPQLVTFTTYRTPGGSGLSLSSGSWFTFHQDFWNGWAPDQMEALNRRCIQAEVNCRARRSPALVPLGQRPETVAGR